MSITHSPGPWRTVSFADGTEGIIATAANGTPVEIATCRHARAKPNARLMRAAPELLDALRLLQAWATDVIGPEGFEIPAGHPILKARDAIAEATGGKP